MTGLKEPYGRPLVYGFNALVDIFDFINAFAPDAGIGSGILDWLATRIANHGPRLYGESRGYSEPRIREVEEIYRLAGRGTMIPWDAAGELSIAGGPIAPILYVLSLIMEAVPEYTIATWVADHPDSRLRKILQMYSLGRKTTPHIREEVEKRKKKKEEEEGSRDLGFSPAPV